MLGSRLRSNRATPIQGGGVLSSAFMTKIRRYKDVYNDMLGDEGWIAKHLRQAQGGRDEVSLIFSNFIENGLT